MKRQSILAAVIAVTGFMASSQINYGLHAGVGFNKISTPAVFSEDGLQNFSYMIGPQVGVFAAYNISDYLDIQAELNYTMRGYKDKITLDVSEITMHEANIEIKSSYIELPVLAKLYPFPQTDLSVHFGPQIGVLIDRHLSMSEKVDFEGFSTDDNRLDFGLNFGVGYIYNRIGLDVRYYLGLCKTYKEIPACKNRGFGFTVAYYLK